MAIVGEALPKLDSMPPKPRAPGPLSALTDKDYKQVVEEKYKPEKDYDEEPFEDIKDREDSKVAAREEAEWKKRKGL